MGVSASALALSRPFEFSGEKINVKPLTYEACARFTLWIEERSMLAMERASQASGSGVEWRSAHLENVASGKYEIGSVVFSETTKTDAGFRKLMELMIDHPEAERLSWDIDSEDEPREAMRALCSELNRDPTAKKLRRRPTEAEKEKSKK